MKTDWMNLLSAYKEQSERKPPKTQTQSKDKTDVLENDSLFLYLNVINSKITNISLKQINN